MFIRLKYFSKAILCSWFLIVITQVGIAQSQKYGKVDFNASCSNNVQEDFNRALAMLHNMMYVTARSDFQAIAEADPNCAMAYWGIATTLFQPLWGTRPSEQDRIRGWENTKRALDLVDSRREELLVKSTAAFYRNPKKTDFWPRIERWSMAVKKAYETYPNDEDIASLYALSLLSIAQRAQNRAPLHDEAEALLRQIFNNNPSHPGAIHYVIHATDADGRAENALNMVDAYGKIAPDVPHALHMPTHIYVRMGRWPEVIDWNKKSAEAALNHPVDGSVSLHYAHAIDYLVYAYLQRGEDSKAESFAKELFSKGPHQASFPAAFHLAAIPARMAVEQQNWNKAANLQPRTPEYLPWDASPWAEGLTWFARGLGAYHTDDLQKTNKAKQKLEKLRDHAKASGAEDIAAYIEIDRRILAGFIEHAKNNNGKAISMLETAVELENNIEKHPITPGALLPPNEALGYLLMKVDRASEALKAFEASDAVWPNRYNTLLGAAQAAERAGKELVAQKYSKKILEVAPKSERLNIREAKRSIDEN